MSGRGFGVTTYPFERSEAAWAVRLFVVFHVAVAAMAVAWIVTNRAAFFIAAIPAIVTAIGFRALKFRVDRRSVTEADPSPDRSPSADYALVEAAWSKLGRRQPSPLRYFRPATVLILGGVFVFAWWAGRIPGLTH